MMQNLLLDVLPYYPEEKVTIKVTTKEVTDTIDTIVGAGQGVADGAAGSGNSSLPFILGGILAALVGLGFLVFMVRKYRSKGEQQLSLG